MSEPGQWFESDPLWFKRAVFYEIHIRGFFDGNDDGSGDFRGLIDKLDYLQWLGIDCIWLLPMYASPLRDGGYVVVVQVEDTSRSFSVGGLPAGTYALSYATNSAWNVQLPDATISGGQAITASLAGPGVLTISRK